jgi:hypothetical protein
MREDANELGLEAGKKKVQSNEASAVVGRRRFQLVARSISRAENKFTVD